MRLSKQSWLHPHSWLRHSLDECLSCIAYGTSLDIDVLAYLLSPPDSLLCKEILFVGMDKLPPLDAPSLSITRTEITRLIRQDLPQLDTDLDSGD